MSKTRRLVSVVGTKSKTIRLVVGTKSKTRRLVSVVGTKSKTIRLFSVFRAITFEIHNYHLDQYLY
jgi:hypothetical protein